MVSLGAAFAFDRQLPWNRGGSNGLPLAERAGPAQARFDGAMQYIDSIAGKENEHLVRAMVRIRNFDMAEAPDSSDGQLPRKICAQLEKFYPEKYADEGDALNLRLATDWITEAAALDLSGGPGSLLYSALCFMLGSGCAADPLFPWLVDTVQDPSASDSEKVARLHRLALEHIDESPGK